MSKQPENEFQKKPRTQTRLKGLADRGFIIIVTRAFGPNGEDLIDRDGPRFSGERGVKIRVRQGELEEDVILSPFYGDPSKLFTLPFKEGEPCELLCPESGMPLEKIPGMSSDEGGDYCAIYLSPKLHEGEIVAINNIWGNPNSNILSEGELLGLLADSETSEAEAD